MPIIDKLKLSKEISDRYSVKDNTFILPAKTDWKDKIDVEVGDSKNLTDFVPSLKISRWEEVNLEIKLKDNEIGTEKVGTLQNKIIWTKGNIIAHFYEFTEGEGGYEFEVILKEKPLTNKIEFTLNTKGLDFFYQPELTQREKDQGSFRADEIIGSYAVYTSEQKTNWEGGKLYRTGKFGHIFRPKIIDSIGKETWGILNIDKGILSVEIPQEFLDKAIYPIKHAAGLTFGYDTGALGSNTGFTNYIKGTSGNPGQSGTASSISAYLKNRAAGRKVRFALYDANNNFVAQTPEDTSGGADGWYTFNFSSGVEVTNQNYRIVGWGDSDTWITYGSVSGYTFYYQTVTYAANFPATISPSTLANNAGSIYCTYTAGVTEKLVTDVGSGVDAILIKAIVGLLDNGIGIESPPSILGKIPITDLGNGIDNILWVAKILTSDSGTATEILNVLSKLVIQDSGAGAEVLSILNALTISDSVIGTEAISALAKIAISDSSLATEALTILCKLAVQDTAQGQEAINILSGFLLQDTGIGADLIGIASKILIQDSGLGTEILNILYKIAISDLGYSQEAVDILSRIAVQDSGVSGEVVEILNKFLVQDLGIGTDEISTIIKSLIQDTGTGQDLLHILVKTTISDGGLGTETIGILIRLAIQDIGIGTEIISILSKIAITDVGISSEAITILAKISISDSGIAEDAIGVLTKLAIQDSGIAIETINILSKILISDLGLGKDEVAVLLKLAISDIAIGIDGIEIKQILQISDTGVGIDSIQIKKIVELIRRIGVLLTKGQKSAIITKGQKSIIKTKGKKTII